MKKLNLESYGVCAMSIEEMRTIEGGNLMKFFEWVGIADMLADFGSGFIEGVQAGYAAHRNCCE
jgi:hypothetical protein